MLPVLVAHLFAASVVMAPPSQILAVEERAATRQVVERMIEAHGGMEPWLASEALGFTIFSRVQGSPLGFLSRETVERATGRAVLDWPLWDARVVFDGLEAWSVRWPIESLPPGFFARLTYSFIAMPWLTRAEGARLGALDRGTLPGDGTEYLTVRMTFDGPSPSLPGTYYLLFIDPETYRLKAIEFDITHPGMVVNPGQAIGPNVHVFEEWVEVGGLLVPTWYETVGTRPDGSHSRAVHAVFDIDPGARLTAAALARPADAVVDELTTGWWRHAANR